MNKKWIALILCAAVAVPVALTGCGSSGGGSSAASTTKAAATTTTEAREQIPNPFVDCDTLADAAKVAGFEMTAPDTVEGYPTRSITAIDGEMIDVTYTAANGGSVLVRKGNGSGDISGDYNTYDKTETAAVGGMSVTLKGNGDKVSVASWQDGSYAYAIVSADGLAKDLITELVAQVK